MFKARLKGVAEVFGALERDVDRELFRAFEREGRRVAEEAKRVHPFQNRTGDLEDSIAPLAVSGRASENSLEGGVVALMDYASFVNDRPEFEFLELAFNLTRSEFEQDIDAALQYAARHSGL
jgi:hypothetical protein